MRQGHSPRKILQDLVPSGTVIPEGLDPIMLWKIIINIVSEPPKRKKLNDINTLDDVLQLLNTSKKIIVLTGAGVSTVIVRQNFLTVPHLCFFVNIEKNYSFA